MAARRLRYAMIGGGPGAMIGPIHRLAARLDDRWELVAGALSSDPARAARGAVECRIAPERSHADWRALIASEAARGEDRIDAVVIVTPNHLHAAPAVAALEAGFHVICDKPIAATLSDALAIERAAHAAKRAFVLTHTYSGYPMVRMMRAMVSEGRLGTIRTIQLQYAQDWLARTIETGDNKQAAWRTDPARSGAGGALGDIGTHAYHLGGFVTGLQAEAVFSDLSAFGEGRTLDDNAHILLRYAGGAKGMMWLSQIAPGKGNQLRIGVYGSEAGVEWDQENPNQLRYTVIGAPSVTLERGGPGGLGGDATRTPAHHPEGYLEAFAQLYSDAADLIVGFDDPDASGQASMLPGIEDGIEGLRFVAGAVAAHAAERWIERTNWG
ncbi:Gfo/Idh/MocA family protein [Sphingomonas nostoxanthinifaciens]|uniref:Gfo/Idh/MocA family protein n=1 Tax=Sphingomonas nostoxanthinifaciens TaxID=2872652 RepID=UPI001CC1F784|nr:Gfo/Idh/MocA family oxidoreductase [Sphingomonas nostoxanthinifaciens]UAK23713.1 Gfo/Idh/MocA family oxidoreductase [Sphingomonas nostoxanthinifaciens]